MPGDHHTKRTSTGSGFDSTTTNGTGSSKNASKTTQTAEKINFIYLLLMNLSKLWHQSIQYVDEILINYGIYNHIDNISSHLSKHPILALGISATAISIGLPFIVFMIFAITTVIMTFTGFVVIEGTLITFASIMLFGFLGAVLLVFLFFGCCILAAYFGFLHIYDLFDRKPKHNTVYNANNYNPPQHQSPTNGQLIFQQSVN